MLAAERRSRRDVVAAAAIVLLVALLAGVVWWRSDARATTSEVAASPLPAPVAATTVPGSLVPLWSAPSGATAAPAVAAGAVVTADGSTVQGRDPASGEVAWTYARDLPLCAATAQFDRAVAVFRDGQGCSQVTSLTGATGARAQQRTGDADDAVTLSGDGTYLAAVGSTRLELWRSDLVRTLEYGRVDALVAPDAQPRTGCTLLSYDSTSSMAAVVQRCPGEDSDRLSLLDPAPSDAAKPQETASVLLTGSGARVLASTTTLVAVLLPSTPQGPQVAVHDATGAVTAQYAVPLTGADLAALGDDPVLPGTDAAPVTTVAVGSTLLALSTADLTLAWSTAGVQGSGAVVAGRLLVPTVGALTELDATSGAVGRSIPVDRSGWTGPVTVAAAGAVLLEQRGDTLAALGS